MIRVFRVRLIILLIADIFFVSSVSAQNQNYWIFFKDKNDVIFNPSAYFCSKAIERRHKSGISFDSTDYPLNESYVESIRKIAENLYYQSSWLNAVAVKCNSSQIKEIVSFPFVTGVKRIEMVSKTCAYKYDTRVKDDWNDLLKKQTERMQGSLFRKNNINGHGVRIAIFDAGFPGVDKNPIFESIREEGRIIKTYDFVRGKENVYRHNQHGTMVLSCIAGMIDTVSMGLATGAEFLLARTETFTEPYSEEVNWMAAVEWADKNGAQIISSSLGYNYKRYFDTDMNGHTSLVSKAANLAAKKGILVITAMGNEGDSRWTMLVTPADADSALSIAGIDPEKDIHISFSSFGPTADWRMKPNVCAYGEAIVAGSHKLEKAYGTSFSTPLVAGFAACALQLRKGLKNMELFKDIERSAHLYPYYDYAHGYGVPQASFFTGDYKIPEPTFSFEVHGDTVTVKIKHELTPETTIIYNKNEYIYYHIANKNNVLEKFAVLNEWDETLLEIPLEKLSDDKVLRVHYKGYTASFKAADKDKYQKVSGEERLAGNY